MIDNGITWGDPPPRNKGGGSGSGRLQKLLADVQARPGVWAKLPGDFGGGAGQFKQRYPNFEFTGRALPGTTRYHIYARYTGGAS